MQQHILRIYLALFFVSGFALSAAAQHKLGHLDSFAAGQLSVASESQGNAATLAEAPMQMEAPGLDEIAITVRGNQIRVQHAEGLTLMVYNITGVKVSTHRVESDDYSFTLNVDRGIYIVKVGKVARRITIG